MKILPGYKSYVVAAIAVAYGVLELVQGAEFAEVAEFVFGGAGLAAARAAVAKVEEAVDILKR